MSVTIIEEQLRPRIEGERKKRTSRGLRRPVGRRKNPRVLRRRKGRNNTVNDQEVDERDESLKNFREQTVKRYTKTLECKIFNN